MSKKKPRKTIPEMLAAKIKEEIGVECDPSTFQRTYAGRNQKAAGAFVWVMVPEGKPDSLPENMWLIGSAEPASRLVKEKHHLDFDEKEGEIFGEEKEEEQEKDGYDSRGAPERFLDRVRFPSGPFLDIRRSREN